MILFSPGRKKPSKDMQREVFSYNVNAQYKLLLIFFILGNKVNFLCMES